jgi:hypothetical protein
MMRSFKNVVFLVVFVVVLWHSVPYLIDLGKTNSHDGPDHEVLSIALQSDGRAVFGGTFRDHIQRRDVDGALDERFSALWNADGFNHTVHAVATEVDDQIVAVGEFTAFDTSLVGHVCRLNSDGTIDTEFANNIGTGFNDTAYTVSIQSDGTILVGGQFTSFNGYPANQIARLLSSGMLDQTFDPKGEFDAPVLAIQGISATSVIVGGAFTRFRGVQTQSLLRIDINQ